MREGIARAFDVAADISIVAEAASAAQAMDAVRRVRPNVVLLANSLPDEPGITIIQALRRQPGAPFVLMLSAVCDGPLIRRAIEAGASGYLVKSDVDSRDLREAMRAVVEGQKWMSRLAANSLASCVGGRDRRPGETLTPRERQVWGLIAAGRSNRSMAQQLGISERTVKYHVSNVLKKLRVSSRSEATALAYSSSFMSNA